MSGNAAADRLAELERAIGGGQAVSDDERDRRHRVHELRRSCARCFKCDVELTETVYRVRVTAGRGFRGPSMSVMPHCEKCALEEVDRKPWLFGGLAEGPAPYPCAICDRTVVQTEWRRRLPVCSPRCSLELTEKRLRERREAEKAQRTRVCEDCGKDFTPEREDARYCPGGACKQRAYRRRRAAG